MICEPLQVLAQELNNRSVHMLAHEPDNRPVGGEWASWVVTTAVIVLCLMLMSPGLRGRSCPGLNGVLPVVAGASAYRVNIQRTVYLRARRRKLLAE